MKFSYIIVGMLVFLLCAGIATAADPDNIVISGSKDWVVANNSDSLILTAHVTNNTLGNVEGAQVQFYLTDTVRGSISTVMESTNSYGNATTTFTTKTLSGDVIVRATLLSNGKQSSTTVHIDHDTPYQMSVDYSNAVEVGTLDPIYVHLQDRYGNPIDNKRNIEKIHFKLVCVDPDAMLKGTWETIPYNGTDIFSVTDGLPVDRYGNVNVTLSVSTSPNVHVIQVDPLNMAISDKFISVQSTPSGVPWYIHRMVSPSSANPYIPADGKSTGSITYTLYDRYFNPMPGKTIIFLTNGGNSTNLVTTATGSVTTPIGPKSTPEIVTYLAKIDENQTRTASVVVDFYDNTPSNLIITANPNSIMSLDVLPESKSLISAVVTDKYGIGSPGENVHFSVGGIWYDPSDSNVTSGLPYTAPVEIATDSDGYAISYFIPSGFTKDQNATNYYTSVTGHANIYANWTDSHGTLISKTTPIQWKNSPYISVYTFISNNTLVAGQEVQISLLVKADGPALESRPIDVILAMGRDIGMLDNKAKGIVDPILSTRPAAKIFNSFMKDNDRVGLTTFGDKGWADLLNNDLIGRAKLVGDDNDKNDDKTVVPRDFPGNNRTYDDYVTKDQGLTFNLDLVNASIDQIVPFSESNSANGDGIPLRGALYESITDLKTKGRSSAVKAVVALVDQGFNWYGDPLARGTGETDWSAANIEKGNPSNQWIAFPLGGPYTNPNWNIANGNKDWQNMSKYAKDNNIKIFIVSYTDSVTADRQREFDILAEGTGGFHRHAATEADLITIYKELGATLRQEAAINATAKMNLTKVKLNDIVYNGSDVFSYIYDPGVSTTVHRWNATYNHFFNMDQRTEWATSAALTFPIGTLSVGDSWQANFTLRVNEGYSGIGTIPYLPSEVTFEGGEGGSDSIPLPEIIIDMAQPEDPKETSDSLSIVPGSFVWTNPDPAKDVVSLQWQLNYTGNQTLREEIWYQAEGSNIKHKIPTNPVKEITPPDGVHVINDGVSFYVKDLIPSNNGKYYFYLYVSVPSNLNTNPDDDKIGPMGVNRGTSFIKLF